MTRGGRVCFFSNLRNRRLAEGMLRRLCLRMSSTVSWLMISAGNRQPAAGVTRAGRYRHPGCLVQFNRISQHGR